MGGFGNTGTCYSSWRGGDHSQGLLKIRIDICYATHPAEVPLKGHM
jgi:hypothetical protein